MTITGITPVKFASLKMQLSKEGTVTYDSAASTSGTVSGHGVTAMFSYDGSAVLTVTVTHKPFYLSEDQVESHIRAALA